MRKITYNKSTRSFSIQGETGMQLRNLKDFLDSVKKPETAEYPTLPTFYKNMRNFVTKVKLVQNVQNILKVNNLKLDDYLPAMCYTRQEDKDHDTKLLDEGFVIVMHVVRDNEYMGAAINLKDRSGTEIYTFKIDKDKPLTPKDMRLCKGKLFSGNDNELYMFNQDIEDMKLKWRAVSPDEELPEEIKRIVKRWTMFDNSLGEYDYLVNWLLNQVKLYEFYNYNIYKVDGYYIFMNPDQGSDPIIKIYR